MHEECLFFFYVTGCLPFCKKKKFGWKSNGLSNFPGNAFGNYRLPPDVVLFISVRNRTEAIPLPISKFSAFQSLINPKELWEI